jgi:CheY-like chemotaxis protein
MPTVMVVEDEEELNEVLRYNLERAGYLVVASFDGAEALTKIRSQPPDLILLDVMLPGLDGWALSRRIHEELPRIPIVYFTARGTREDFDRARQFANFAGYFIKPYATADVMRHIEKVLGGRSAGGED